jgi:hypothetical protein
MSDFTCPKLAQLTGYTPRHILRFARLKKIPGASKTSGGQFRFADGPKLWLWIESARSRRAKRGSQEEGNTKLKTPPTHHFSIINRWGNWQRQLRIGKVKPRSADELKRDFLPLYNWLQELYRT